MKNEDVLDLVKQCNLSEGEELIPRKAYLIKNFANLLERG